VTALTGIEEAVRLPDLSGYRLHRVAVDAEFESVAVPGLRAEFFRRTGPDGRVASVGRYRHGGRELLMAWGFVDEEHCRYSAVRGTDGIWGPPMPGCPRVSILREGAIVVGLEVQAADGSWVGGALDPAAR
jgi:hypothetical protein